MSNPFRTFEWVAVENQLPEREETVLVSYMEPDYVSTGFWNGRQWRCHESGMPGSMYNTPTHWARLPIGFGHTRR